MEKKPLYSIPCNRAYYEPKNMTRRELEDGFMDLVKRLTSFQEILRRSLYKPKLSTFILLKMNLSFRKDYQRMASTYWERRKASDEAMNSELTMRTRIEHSMQVEGL
jgi:hypothetical protein